MAVQEKAAEPGGFTFPDLRSGFKAATKRSDIFFAFGIVGILVVLLLPVPPAMLDFLLGISITISVLILMTVLFVGKPLALSSFPTILLIATMLRLALNIASTRLILSHGHEGTDAAGHVIEAFGQFVMTGSVLIGAILFCILTIINFVVITKGSGRIAEVSARFSLDAMPGKQMAIDADLSAGLINEDIARSRRKELEDENSFYGAMDGASKFVRGDAIAGILITFINFIGGLIIGIVQRDMDFQHALEAYTLLTIGDGLVAQIPALIVSTAAGLLVTKSGDGGSAEKEVLGQLMHFPAAAGMTSALLFVMAMIPGLPALPFLVLASTMGYVAWWSNRKDRPPPGTAMTDAGGMVVQRQGPDGTIITSPAGAQPGGETKQIEEQISDALHIDNLRLELGYGLLPLINYTKGHRLTEQIKALRRQIARELGFVIPPVRIQDNMQLPANSYVVKVKEVECGRGDIRPDMLLVMNPTGAKILLPGEETTEPTFGLPAMWVADNHREEALFRNYTVVDPPTVITTHLTEVIKDNMADLLSYAEVQKLLDDMGKPHQKLISEIIPNQISINGVQRVLQNLLSEVVSIRDLATIIEAIAESSRVTQNLTLITEHVRTRLSRQISHANTVKEGYIPIIAMSPAWEQIFVESLSGKGEEKLLSMAPSKIQEFITIVRKRFDEHAMKGELPILLTSPGIRPYVRSIIERFRSATVVLSQNEIHPKARIKTLGQL